ncbi:MAG: DUF1501 domain-containing protein [Planctomycetaceae bacterium]|nr:DUF1501 domain-containing protein [Planctomycetaceae bacterium]
MFRSPPIAGAFQPVGCQPRLSRRQVLQVGGLGLMGVSLPRLLAAQQVSDVAAQCRADACVVLFLDGGPSHLDMWDLKPNAPDGIRGEFKPIATSLPGYQVSEHMPRLATQMHRWTVVRSMRHGVNNAHAAAVYVALTGHDRGEIGGGTQPTDNPSPGSVLALLRPPERPVVPHVTLPYITKEGAGGPPQPGFFGGYLGSAYDPLFVLKDPNAADFAVPELTLLGDVSLERLSARRALFGNLDKQLLAGAGRDGYDAMDSFQRKALELLTSADSQRAFRLADEPDPVREAYGRNIYGQSVLLARRLIEAGTRMVTIAWAPDANATWDTHGSNFASLKNTLLPQLDAACSSLVDDLAERGLLDRTLVAVMGDFGRTPKINANNAGRDHWNYCYSLMLCGGGIRPGYVHGSSDSIGAFPASAPLTPADIISTIYHQLGIRPDREMHDRLGRPHRLVPTGDVVPALLA